MDERAQQDLERRAWQLLQPGAIDLHGLVVRTEFDSQQEPAMHQATVEIGDQIARHAGYDPTETFVYSGTDDPEFASNQHQGRRLGDESFVWECQQLLRSGSFDIVFYFDATADTGALLAAVEAAGYDATGLDGTASSPAAAVIDD